MKSVVLVAAAAALVAPAANAQIDSVRLGVMKHNICVADCKNADKEDGPVIDVQVNFKSPEFLGWAFSPKPYIAIAPNASGDTSFAAVGLEWRWEFVDGWAFVPAFGYAVHDGEVKNAYTNGTPQATQFSDDHVLYGSRDLFRTALGLQREFGQILGSGRNQGTDQAGVRIGYRFGQ